MAERIACIVCVILLLFAGLSCVTQPSAAPYDDVPVAGKPADAPPAETPPDSLAVETPPPEAPPVEAAPAKAPEKTFDPASVTKEVYEATLFDIKKFIEQLNTIIRNRDYDTWIGYLSPEYIAETSDPAYLAKISETPILKRQSITLRSLKDYFLYVVVPSRQNDRVDEIEFVGEDRIVAFTLNAKGERLVLYYLEKLDHLWKIGFGR